MTDFCRNGRRRDRALRVLFRWAAPGAMLLQLTNCSATNTELIVYQYELALRNLVVDLIGTVLSAVI